MRSIPSIVRTAAVALVVTAAVACSEKKVSDQADLHPNIRREIEAAALRVVEQNENWGPQVEFKIYKVDDMWRVTAWRVEHPEAKGDKRYVPWGARTMVVDRNYRVLEYRSGAK